MIGNQCPVKADSAMSYDDDYGYTQEAEYEKSQAAKSSMGDSAHGSMHGSVHGTPNKGKAPPKKSLSLANSKEKDEQIMASIRERLNLVLYRIQTNQTVEFGERFL